MRRIEHTEEEVERCKGNPWALLGIALYPQTPDPIRWRTVEMMTVHHDLWYDVASAWSIQQRMKDDAQRVYITENMIKWAREKPSERHERASEFIRLRMDVRSSLRAKVDQFDRENVEPAEDQPTVDVIKVLRENTDEPWAWYAIITKGASVGKPFRFDGYRLSKEEWEEAYAFVKRKYMDELSAYALQEMLMDRYRANPHEEYSLPGIVVWIKQWYQVDPEKRYEGTKYLSYHVFDSVRVDYRELSYGDSPIQLVVDQIKHAGDWDDFSDKKENIDAMLICYFFRYGSHNLSELFAGVPLPGDDWFYPLGRTFIQLWAISWAYNNSNKRPRQQGESRDNYVLSLVWGALSRVMKETPPTMDSALRMYILFGQLLWFDKQIVKRHYEVMIALASARTLPRSDVRRTPLARLPVDLTRTLGQFLDKMQ